MNKGLAKTLHAKVGDEVSIQGNSFTLVEIINDLEYILEKFKLITKRQVV